MIDSSALNFGMFFAFIPLLSFNLNRSTVLPQGLRAVLRSPVVFPMFCGFFSSRAAIWLLAPSVPLPVTGVGQTNTGMAAGLIFAQCGLLIRPVNWTPPFLERYPSCTRATPSGSRAVQSHPPPSICLFSLSSFVQAVMVCHSQRQDAGSQMFF